MGLEESSGLESIFRELNQGSCATADIVTEGVSLSVKRSQFTETTKVQSRCMQQAGVSHRLSRTREETSKRHDRDGRIDTNHLVMDSGVVASRSNCEFAQGQGVVAIVWVRGRQAVQFTKRHGCRTRSGPVIPAACAGVAGVPGAVATLLLEAPKCVESVLKTITMECCQLLLKGIKGCSLQSCLDKK